VSGSVRVLVLIVAAIGFLFDTYELLMFPVIGTDAVAELVFQKPFPTLTFAEQRTVGEWGGRMLWIAALCGGVFGLIGGLLIDRFGRKTVMAASILLYSFSPVCAAFSTSLSMLIVFRCTTFIGVCVEMVAAVTWLAELFENKRHREMAIGWTLAAASLGGILVTEVYLLLVDSVKKNPEVIWGIPFPLDADKKNLAWRYTLLTGLVPGLLILLLLPFVPESKVWKEKKLAGTLSRPWLRELFAPNLIRTTLVTTVLSACAYAAAFGCLQMTPLRIVEGSPGIAPKLAEGRKAVETAEKAFLAADKEYREAFNAYVGSGVPVNAGPPETQTKVSDEQKKLLAAKETAEAAMKKAQGEYDEAKKKFAPVAGELRTLRGDIQRWQELGGLLGRILLASLLLFIPSRLLLRLFLVPGIVLLPITYFVLQPGEYVWFAVAIFFCGLLTVAQFSYMSEFLPKVFPVHLRGTGGGFATNVGGRMLGTMAATLNTEVLSKQFDGTSARTIAIAAACIGGTVYLLAFAMSFVLPKPQEG
jgi:MFS family permease